MKEIYLDILNEIREEVKEFRNDLKDFKIILNGNGKKGFFEQVRNNTKEIIELKQRPKTRLNTAYFIISVVLALVAIYSAFVKDVNAKQNIKIESKK